MRDKLVIKLSTANEAFDGGWDTEAARILQEVVDLLKGSRVPFDLEMGNTLWLRDKNGNKVGSVELTTT